MGRPCLCLTELLAGDRTNETELAIVLRLLARSWIKRLKATRTILLDRMKKHWFRVGANQTKMALLQPMITPKHGRSGSEAHQK